MDEEERTQPCPICKAPMDEQLQDYYIDYGDDEIQIEGVPVWVCPQCGYTEVEANVIEAVEDMLDHLDTVAADEEE